MIKDLLLKHNLLKSPDAKLTQLTGGVSSEIYRVEDDESVFVVKRALEKLKVQQEWLADTSRNFYEQAFMEYVSSFRPDAVPKLLFSNTEDGFFCMEFLDGFLNWKEDLLAGKCDFSLAEKAGSLLGKIHNQSTNDKKASESFQTAENFEQLRIDPYLRTTAKCHPKLHDIIQVEADRLFAAKECLVHGDFSPKNILHKEGRLVVLDCEVAWYGDPAFDVGFFLNHFCLKALYHSALPHCESNLFFEMAKEVLSAYRRAYPDSEQILNRTSHLLPMLLLARVDGKSPVEYLTDNNAHNVIRNFSEDCLLTKIPCSIDDRLSQWFQVLKDFSHENQKS